MLTHIEQLIGRTIGDYRLLRVLGRGGTGTVFLACPVAAPEEQVAVKILFPDQYTSPENVFTFKARFTRETRVMRRLTHGHIVPLQDAGETEELLYLVMPYLAGGSLNTLLRKRQGPLPLVEIAGYLGQIGEALDYIHGQEIVHCDIKPGNVLLDLAGNVYITDFGIARLLEAEVDDSGTMPISLTSAGEIFGTPPYMAPELFLGERATPASDIYALGVMLYRLVTGELPFTGRLPVEIGLKHLGEHPPSPCRLRTNLPEEAAEVILRALAKAPSDRYSSAGKLASAFAAGLEGGVTAGVTLVGPQGTGLRLQDLAPRSTTIRSQDELYREARRPRGVAAYSANAGGSRSLQLTLAGVLSLGLLIVALVSGIALNRIKFSTASSLASLGVAQQSGEKILAANRRKNVKVTATPGGSGIVPRTMVFDPSTLDVEVNNHSVVAMSTVTKGVAWRYDAGSQILPAAVTADNAVYCVTYPGQVFALRAASGKLLWSYRLFSAANSSLVVENGTVFVSDVNGENYELRALDGLLLANYYPQPVPTQGFTPTPLPTKIPTPRPTKTPTPVPTKTPTPVPTKTPTPVPTSTPTPVPTSTPTPVPTNTPTPVPTNTPVPPTNTPTPGQTPTPQKVPMQQVEQGPPPVDPLGAQSLIVVQVADRRAAF